MRVLLTVHQFFPEHTTGTEVLTFEVARELVRRGHEVRLFTGHPLKAAPESGQLFDSYEYRGIQVERYYHHESAPVAGQSNIAELEYCNRLFEGRLRRLLEKWQPDLVHFFHLKNLSASSIDVCRSLHVPMLLTPTDFWLICPTSQLLLPDGSLCAGPDRYGVNCLRHAVANTQSATVGRIFSAIPDALVAGGIRVAGFPGLKQLAPFSWVNALARRADYLRQRAKWLDCIVAPTRFMEQILVSNGVSSEKLVYRRFGINLTGFDSPVTGRGSLESLRIGFIGSLAHPKGAHVLLEAVRRIPPGIELEVQLFGNPHVYPDYVESLLELAGDDPRICFCGTFPNEEIARVLSDMDVLVIPSVWYENTPLVIYSAQAAGCPVVASDLGGMSEVVRENVDGLLFPPGDSSALASILQRLCKDRGLVGELEKNAPRPKSIGKYTDELESLYQDIIAAG